MKKPLNRALRMWAICATMLLLVGVFSVATYAWFTTNRLVKTDNVQIRSGTETLKLEISSTANGTFSQEADITQISNAKVLDPVSTADLATFFKSVTMENNSANTFAATQDGYYHGQVFLRATAEGMPTNSVLSLYIDTAGVAVTDTETPGLLLNAARVGLIFSANPTPIIFSLSNEHITGNHNSTTIPNAPDGDFVLNSATTAVPDPAVIATEYTVTEANGQLNIPQKNLIELPLNTVCTVDIYFYIEGCDVDCTNDIRATEMSIQLPFYGVLTEKGGAA
ncbi:MAG: hypothetical protein EOM30_06125 [Clostridia bacterium]|nr:hypothetical protein [Clostridia bacterium]NLS85634.1 hypothetical protein [Oscillospiraceae bacterium]